MWLEQEEGDEGAGERKVLLQEGEEERTGELGFSPFNCMPDDDWCFDHAGRHRGFGFSGDPSPAESLLLQSAANSSSSGSPPSVFNLDPSSSSSQPFFPQQTRDDSLPSIFAVVASNPFDEFLQNPSLLMHSICANEDADGCTPFFGRTKVLQPLDVLPATGAPPTLFQKRAAALRQSSEPGAAERERSISALSDGNELSGVNYDGAAINGGEEDAKGKKKGFPAKNLMAERRRRKKLNDRLYLLRSVVPKISKMDRASILGDAIEYLKDLLQKINDLHEELAGTPPSLPPLPGGGGGASFHPLTPTLPALPPRVKEELCPSSLQSPNAQIPKVEVREREGRAVNIHMFCTRKPGILLSTMKALDNLGLDVQQAVISCFNGFAVDIFRAEPYNDSPRIRADEIKAVLLHSVNCLGSM